MMTTEPRIGIEAVPENPAHYLACCGIFEIAVRLDKAARACWSRDAPTRFLLDTGTDEAALTQMIVEAVTSEDYWQSVKARNNPDAVRYIKLEMRTGEAGKVVFYFDWWYETFNDGYEEIKNEGAQFTNSAWKMYAGNQGIEYYIRQARIGCSTVKNLVGNSLSSLLMVPSDDEEVSGQGFGFDPRSARHALDVGYSPDKVGEGVVRYPFADLLGMIGAQYFFPHRTHEAKRLHSTRGWTRAEIARFFRYGIWYDLVPLVIAKVLAAGTNEVHFRCDIVRSVRASRKNYSNLTFAIPTE